MLNSMTGHGSHSMNIEEGHLFLEISSLNHKTFEISLSIPNELSSFEAFIRKKIAENISRGSVKVKVILSTDSIENSVQVLKNLKKRWEKIATKLGFEKESITLPFLLDQMPTRCVREDLKEPLFESLEKALKNLITMRQNEGSLLEKDIRKKLKNMEKRILEISKEADSMNSEYKKKIVDKAPFLEEKELFLYLEKRDIEEEVVRLKSHLAQFYTFLKEKGSIGKTLEFIIQEMQRETTTIASKVGGFFEVVELRKEIERIREQVQNIE